MSEKKVIRAASGKEQLLQQPPEHVTLEEYMRMSGFEWWRRNGEYYEEEVLNSCRIIIVDIYFREHIVQVTQDNRTRT